MRTSSSTIDRRTVDAVALLPDIAAEAGVTIRVVRDTGTFVRGVLTGIDGEVDIDLVFESVADIHGPDSVEGVQVELPADLREQADVRAVPIRTE
ncbi:MAG: hypothetical protein Q8O42_22485 [Acidobacteriota bacterium]|nr:hypothetical protein [Acidobacteriota bacterium]